MTAIVILFPKGLALPKKLFIFATQTYDQRRLVALSGVANLSEAVPEDSRLSDYV